MMDQLRLMSQKRNTARRVFLISLIPLSVTLFIAAIFFSTSAFPQSSVLEDACSEPTIYVQNGHIVGGPQNGKKYRGFLNGTTGDNIIAGTPGRDRIRGYGGNDIICGNDGNDYIIANDGNDVVYGGEGNDTLNGGRGNDELHGGNGKDKLTGFSGTDIFFGGEGDDNLRGGPGNDTIYGGPGNDRISGGFHNDNLYGDEGDDRIWGQLHDDTLDGGLGDDWLHGGAGYDICSGETLKLCEEEGEPQVSDTTPPVITLLGENPITLTLGDLFEDPGATAIDDVDADISDSIAVISTIDLLSVGEYTLTYFVEDQADNSSEVVREVNIVDVVDTTPPVITLLGDNPLMINVGEEFVDPGATAFDDVDGDVSEDIAIVDLVDTSMAGTYEIKYNVDDSLGNTALQVSRRVLVGIESEGDSQVLEVVSIDSDESPIPETFGIQAQINETTKMTLLVPTRVMSLGDGLFNVSQVNIIEDTEVEIRSFEDILGGANYIFERPHEIFLPVVIETDKEIKFVVECDAQKLKCDVLPFGRQDNGAYVFDSSPGRQVHFVINGTLSGE